MRLLLAHPEAASRTCEECKAWLYDPKTGRLCKGADDQPLPRPPHAKTPCWSCAKVGHTQIKTIEEGRKATMSTRNWKTWHLYHQQQACGGVVRDELLRYNFGIIAEVVASYQRAMGQLALSVSHLGV